MHRNNAVRISMIVAVFFVSFLLLFLGTWVYGSQSLEVKSPVNYLFVDNNTAPPMEQESLYNSSAYFTSYGYSVLLESYFQQNFTMSNESCVGKVLLYAVGPGGNRTLVSQLTYNTSNSVNYLRIDIHPGRYLVVTYVDITFLNYNYSQRMGIINSRPGTAGIVSVHLSFPQILYYPVLLFGGGTAISFVMALKCRKSYLDQ